VPYDAQKGLRDRKHLPKNPNSPSTDNPRRQDLCGAHSRIGVAEFRCGIVGGSSGPMMHRRDRGRICHDTAGGTGTSLAKPGTLWGDDPGVSDRAVPEL